MNSKSEPGLSKGRRGPKPVQLAKLFRLKYLDQVSDRKEIAEKLGISVNSIYAYESRLRKKLVGSLKQVTPDRIRFVCPECLEARVLEDHEKGESVCTNCGYVVAQQPSMIHRLPFDQTYALENQLVFNKSLGGTVDKKSIGRVLIKVRNSKAKIEALKEIAEKHREGQLSALEAGREIREILVDGGAGEIAEVLQQIADPKEAARRIVNMFDAIPIRQIMTLHDVHEPLLIRKMKAYAEKFRREHHMDMPNPVCDPDIFSVALGVAVERVGSEALLNKDVRHNPKDLATACFMKTVQRMNPKVKVRRCSVKPETLLYVDHVLRTYHKPVEPRASLDLGTRKLENRWNGREVRSS
jgi:hypothetical protein